MTQKEITTKISAMYHYETLKPAATEVEVFGGETVEVPTNDYVCWLERKLNDLIMESKDEK
jgi:hypothetical protein